MGGLNARAIADRLTALGLAVRSHLLHHRDTERDVQAIGFVGGDTIFGIDRKVEPLLLRELQSWSEEIGHLVAVAEGFGEDGTVSFGPRGASASLRLLIDPIDGTRCLMYDKRSAWFLAAAAPDDGPTTRLAGAIASVMVELPTSKQRWADNVVFAKGEPLSAQRVDIATGEIVPLKHRPSLANTLLNGYGQVSNFFPGTKALASELMERIASAVVGAVQPGMASIFEDQYVSTGGQFVELLFGRDRFCCDLRPIFYDILERRSGRPVPRGIACHPYDIAGLPAALAGGVIITDAFGAVLDTEFSVSTPVHWCGYANESLRREIEPAIRAFIDEHLAH